jgi:iron uptake system component EfeO
MTTHAALEAAALMLVALFATACGSSDGPAAGERTMLFKLTDAGCTPNTAHAKGGQAYFEVENAGTSAVSEFELLEGEEIIGEAEDLSDGMAGGFSAELEKGEYTLYCPGGSKEKGTLTVSG